MTIACFGIFITLLSFLLGSGPLLLIGVAAMAFGSGYFIGRGA